MTHCIVLVTAKDPEEAQRIADALLKEKLVACANIVKDVKSLFWWEGKIDEASETLLVLKTRRALFARVAKTVKMVHSYNVPEIIALPIVSGYNPYLKWIDDSTKQKKK